MAGLDPSILALKDSSAEDRARCVAKRNEGKAGDDKGRAGAVNPRSPTNPRTLRPSLEAMTVQPQGLNQAQGAQDRLARVHARLDKYTEDQLEQVGELGRLKLALSTCPGEKMVRFEADIQKCELEIRVLGEQIQALVESLAVLEPLGDGREKEKKGDMSLGKSIVLGMDKFSCEIGQDPSAHAAEVVQVVNTLNLSDTDKKTAFLATLQGYPLRTMSGVAGDPLVTFVELVAEFRQRYGRGDRDADEALNRVAREDKQGRGESTQLFRDRVHALAHAADKDMDQPTVLRLFIDGLRDERVRQQAALENLDEVRDWNKVAARILEIERAFQSVKCTAGDIDVEGQHNVETCAFLDKSGRRQGDRTGGFEKVSYTYSGSSACHFGGPKFKFRGGRRQDGFQGGYKLCYRFLSGLCDRGVMCKFFHDKGAANFLRRRKRREAGSDRRGRGS